MSTEFLAVESWMKNEAGWMRGVDVGCGTNRLSMEVLAIDAQHDRRYAHNDVIHDCHDLEIGPVKFSGREYDFKDGSLDFIFSSHCLEDFPDIPVVFKNWWKKLNIGGLMILLLPDMELCSCSICQSEQQINYRAEHGMSARYWTLEDYHKTNKGNPSHKTNVGKAFMTKMLADLDNAGSIKYRVEQIDTIAHDKSCSIDFVIRKLG